MPFGAFKSQVDLARIYQITVAMGRFVKMKSYPVNEVFAGDLNFVMQNLAVRMSEASIREFMIAPVLKEIWKVYSDTFLMWVNVSFGTADPLAGTPDYYFSRKSPLGLVPDQPYLIVVEAKKDDFEGGWAQCLAAMLAAQKMNDRHEQTVFGCVSTEAPGPSASWKAGSLLRSLKNSRSAGSRSFSALSTISLRGPRKRSMPRRREKCPSDSSE
jgi:hypothetical protein